MNGDITNGMSKTQNIKKPRIKYDQGMEQRYTRNYDDLDGDITNDMSKTENHKKRR